MCVCQREGEREKVIKSLWVDENVSERGRARERFDEGVCVWEREKKKKRVWKELSDWLEILERKVSDEEEEEAEIGSHQLQFDIGYVEISCSVALWSV